MSIDFIIVVVIFVYFSYHLGFVIDENCDVNCSLTHVTLVTVGNISGLQLHWVTVQHTSVVLVGFMALIFFLKVINWTYSPNNTNKNRRLPYSVNAQRLNLPTSVILLSDRDKGRPNWVLHLGPPVFTQTSPAGWICLSYWWQYGFLRCVYGGEVQVSWYSVVEGLHFSTQHASGHHGNPKEMRV